ncbi:hypothetical protein CAPTEDRAFT_205375 [Capitella teleta]|uniref:Uncharacterized protein n=1 Tax=Capitella teleta TaxID=283909 RepID=R7TM31_CAPTE|nr:hypothetical protein CAPTEDRAFT_205375 [Capitella teleta]|eukprot:ELT94873.1 hypothetical protein CAPTEDRAFT_205375 [Capitella teleta]
MPNKVLISRSPVCEFIGIMLGVVTAKRRLGAACVFLVVFSCLRIFAMIRHVGLNSIGERRVYTGDAPQTILTLCTTFVESELRIPLHAAVVKNWGQLKPHIRPVLFTLNMTSVLSTMARNHGWDVVLVTSFNSHHTPYINNMFEYIYNHYKSEYYGFANGDILFSRSLAETLGAIKNATGRKSVMVVGQRNNVNYHEISSNDVEFWQPAKIQKYMCQYGKQEGPLSLDYFITSPYGFPWSTIPDLVVGRERYDNYLLLMSIYLLITTVDGTNSIDNLHLKGRDKTLTHFDLDVKDKKFNEDAILNFGRINFADGSVHNCEYFTRTRKVDISIQRKLKWESPKYFEKFQSNIKALMEHNR